MTSELIKYLSDTAGCIFKCETTKMRLPKNFKKWVFKEKMFV